MSNIKIFPSKIKGKVKISGSKNSTLPIIAASLVTSEKTILKNVPDINDVKNFISILNQMGNKTSYKNKKLKIKESCKNISLKIDLTKQFRASYYLMSVYLIKFNEVIIYTPGGCKIGARPIDFHLEGFKQAGCSVIEAEDSVYIKTDGLKPFVYKMPKKSLGATVNLLILASKIKGKSIIENASTEPEIDDLIAYINKGMAYAFRMEDSIIIYGEKEAKKKIKHKIMFDRIEAFTYVCIGANSKKIKIKNIDMKYFAAPLMIMKEANLNFEIKDKSVVVKKSKLLPINVSSNNYPHLSTDQMPLLYPLFLRTLGSSIFKEEIFENRFSVCEELKKTGAEINIINNCVEIIGNKHITGANLYATDLRCAASLLIEGLINQNSTIHNLQYLERGYDDIYKKLKKLNVKFKIFN